MKTQNSKLEIPIEVSARHIHLSCKDRDILFGKNYKLKKLKNVSQPNQFATVESLILKGPKKSIENVRIIAPLRDETQVEIAITDAFTLGINPPPVLLSGNLVESVGEIDLIGPKGKIRLNKGLIVAQRHLHIEPELAQKYSLKHGDNISIHVKSKRSVVFNNISVRSRKGKDKLSFQLDTDEGNAACISKDTKGFLIQ